MTRLPPASGPTGAASPDRSAAARSSRSAAVRPDRSAAARRRRAAVVLTAVLALVLAAAWALSACGEQPDPFAGLYWEPSTGRRVEIRVDDGSYHLIYGAGKRAFPATREGDELHITEPLGGVTVVRPGDDGGALELSAGGRTTRLEPLPQHQ